MTIYIGIGKIPIRVHSMSFMVYKAQWTTAWPLWPQLQTESPAPWSCPRSPWETLLCTTASWERHSETDGAAPAQYLWWEEGGTQWGSSHERNLESSGRRVRAVRDEENEGRGKGRRWIKKRRERRQGRSASLVDVAMNDKEVKNHNFNTGIKWRGINNFSRLLLVWIKCWFQCVKDEKIRKTQIILLFQRLLSFGPRTNPHSETHIITVVALANWSYSEENLKCYFVTTLEHACLW